MRRFAFALLLAAGTVSAQQTTAGPTPAANPPLQALAWTAIDGQAAELSVGNDGAVFALDFQGQVWLRRPGAQVAWIKLPGVFRHIAAVSEKEAWAVGEAGEIYFYNGTWWRPLGERFAVEAVDIGASINGRLFAVSAAGRLVALDAARGAVEVPDAPERLGRVAVDDRDLPWVVDRDNRVHRFDGRRWLALEARGRDIAAGNGGVWLIGREGEVVALNPDGTPARPVAARAATLALAPGGQPWLATSDGRIYANNPNTATQSPTRRNEREQVFTQLLNWQRVNGNARQLAISAKGAVLALGHDGEVWQWKSRNNWGRLPGSFTRLALDKENTPWGVAADGRVMRYQGSFWVDFPGSARDIASGPDGSLWIVQTDGTPAFWVERQRAWQALPPGSAVRRLAIAPDGRPWVIDEAGQVARLVDKQWESLPALDAVELAIGPEGTVFVASTDKRLWRWDAFGKRWERLNGEAATVAVGPRGKPWIANADGRIFASAFFDELPDSQVNTVSAAAANAAKVVIGLPPAGTIVGRPGTGGIGGARGASDEALNFQKVTGAARDLAIGADGSVFAINPDSTLGRWSNMRNAFTAFPGQLARLAVMADGKPWGVTTKGEVFRHDGSNWRLVQNIVATDVATASDGTVMVVGPQNVLHRYLPAEDRFERLAAPAEDQPAPGGLRVALEPNGVPWVILADGYVARCEKLACLRLPIQARDIAIGPEGTVFLVDINRALRRWDPRRQDFDRLPLPSAIDAPAAVAVGPRGKPWLATLSGDIWSSAFFPRDERRDITTSATTGSAVATGSTPTFSFTSGLTFDEVTCTCGSFTLVSFAIGASGKVIVNDEMGLLVYDQNINRFKPSSIPNPFGGYPDGIVIGAGDTLWAWRNPVTNMFNGDVRVYRNNTWQSIGGLSAMGMNEAPPMPSMDMAVAGDGSVFAISPDSKLYRYDAARNQFVLLATQFAGDEMALAVEPSGVPWIVSSANQVFQFSGSGFVERKTPSQWGMACSLPGPGCIRAGAGGAVFTIDSLTAKPLRWNAANRQWDKITVNPASIGSVDRLDVAADGRPWIVSNGRLYRAR